MVYETLSRGMDLTLPVAGLIADALAVRTVTADERFAWLGEPDTTAITLRFASGPLGVIDNRQSLGCGYETVLEVGGSARQGECARLRVRPAHALPGRTH